MRRRVRITLLCTTLLAVVALSTFGCNAWVSSTNSAERRWNRQDIDSYRIEVAYIRGVWHFQKHLITVREGQVVDSSASCLDAPRETAQGTKCEVEPFDPQEYTVPGLFAKAQSMAKEYPRREIEMVFDETYSYPALIKHSDPEVLEAIDRWRVESFEVIE
jgi:hypothetical protein